MKTSSTPIVSVILCFFNEEKFLSEAITSVVAQDFSDWELILVDDGSSDDSLKIAKEYALLYPGKIFYVEHRNHANKGLSASRNAGIKRARGEFVAFIDADDVWLSEKLSHQLAIFERNPKVTVVLEASLYWNSWRDPSHIDVIIPVGVKEGVYFPPQLMTALYPLGAGAAPCPSGIMVRESVLTRCHFEESFRGMYQMYEDQAFLCKVYLKEVVYVSAAWNNRYRQRISSLVSSIHQNGHYHTVRCYYLQWFKDYLYALPDQYRSVNVLLKRALMPYRAPFRYKMMVDYPRMGKKMLAGVLVKLGLLKYSKTW